jgi:hypothetical protein
VVEFIHKHLHILFYVFIYVEKSFYEEFCEEWSILSNDNNPLKPNLVSTPIDGVYKSIQYGIKYKITYLMD